MKKVSCASAMILLIITNSFGQQDINSLKGFKYAYVSVLTYDGGRVDIFGITDFIKKELEIKGIKVLNNDINEWPQEAKLNNCLVGNWFPTHSPGGIPNSANGGFIVKNCKGEIVYQNSSFASHFGYFYNKNVPYAVEKAFKIIRTMNYFFDQSFTPKIDYPEVENTTETEESIKQYLSSNKLDPIEGIYKSYQDSHLGYYKVGIIKAEDKFKVIIIETELPQWKAGEVKAYCEFSSMKGIYSTKWYKSNKMAEETFSSLENDAILTVELKDPKGEKYQSKLIKVYPATKSSSDEKNIDSSRGSGSGFFISSSGIIATNAHVIQDAVRIELSISSEDGYTTNYKGKVLLVDNKNDVALVQIVDDNFKPLGNLPYSLVEKAEVGEKVFTIGYPLNNIMGSNFKVTDGIISSKSGIADDIRFFQISVPLQAGNSGGPLFNNEGDIIGITSSKLNSKAVGTSVENVNYAVKISYLINLYTMLPNSNKIVGGGQLANKELKDQVKILKNYVCLIKVF